MRVKIITFFSGSAKVKLFPTIDGIVQRFSYPYLNYSWNMKSPFFFEEEYISIEYDATGKWLYVDWKGYQTEISVKTGCSKMLEALLHFDCHCVLNDNTRVIGIWTPAAAWVGSEWLPLMIQSGLERFAWVYSSSILSQVSTEEAIRHAPSHKGIRTFYNIELAKAWLRS